MGVSMVKIILKADPELISNILFVPSLIFLIMLKYSALTQSPLLQQPTVHEDSIEMQLFFEKELSSTELEDVKEAILKMLSDYFKMSEVEVDIEWQN